MTDDRNVGSYHSKAALFSGYQPCHTLRSHLRLRGHLLTFAVKSSAYCLTLMIRHSLMSCSHRRRDETRQFCLVSNCLTRQDSFVSSASAVWTSHYWLHEKLTSTTAYTASDDTKLNASRLHTNAESMRTSHAWELLATDIVGHLLVG